MSQADTLRSDPLKTPSFDSVFGHDHRDDENSRAIKAVPTVTQRQNSISCRLGNAARCLKGSLSRGDSLEASLNLANRWGSTLLSPRVEPREWPKLHWSSR